MSEPNGSAHERDERGRFAGNLRLCSVERCSRPARHEVGVNTGFMFYLCDEHTEASVMSPPFPGRLVCR